MSEIAPHKYVSRMTERLKQQGLRLTPQRLAVINALAISVDHLSAEQIHNQVRVDFPTTSLTTIYKTLAVLVKNKLLVEIGFSEGSNRYDLVTEAHAHLICVRCKSIIDPELDGISRMVEQIITQYGYQKVSQRLDIFGVCPRCLNMAAS